jgi:hypothetical protein
MSREGRRRLARYLDVREKGYSHRDGGTFFLLLLVVAVISGAQHV